nr:retrovirus-related Pol polyprotein from transposon TNT 1-94 [Tanacetum cinerariifolium]
PSLGIDLGLLIEKGNVTRIARVAIPVHPHVLLYQMNQSGIGGLLEHVRECGRLGDDLVRWRCRECCMEKMYSEKGIGRVKLLQDIRLGLSIGIRAVSSHKTFKKMLLFKNYLRFYHVWNRTSYPTTTGTNTGSSSNSNVNRVDMMPNTETINASPTITVSRSVDDDLLLPQLLDSKGGSHIINVPTFDKDDFTRPSDTRDTKITTLGLKFNAFKALEGPSDTRDTKITTLGLKFNAFKALEGEKDSNSVVEEDNRTSEFMADLNVEYHERALLENQKRFYKRSGRVRKDDKGKGDKKVINGLVAESFDCNDESVSLDDEGITKFKAFMEIADDEPSVGKDYSHVDLQYVEDQRNNLVNKFNAPRQDLALHKSKLCNLKNTVSINFSLKNEVIRVNLENESLKDEIYNLKKVPLPPLLKLTGAEPSGASKSLISLSDLTANMADLTLNTTSKRIKNSFDKVSQTYVIKKKSEHKLPTVQMSCLDKNALPSTEQLLLTLMEEVKGCEICGSIAHEIYDCPKNLRNRLPKEVLRTIIYLMSYAPTDFTPWGEAASVTCYTQNRSIIVKRHRKTAYEVFRGRAPDFSYFYIFGCPVHNHNHKDHLGKFDEKADDGFFLSYSSVAKAFKVFNIKRQKMEESFHVTFSEDDEAISQTSTKGDAIDDIK